MNGTVSDFELIVRNLDGTGGRRSDDRQPARYQDTLDRGTSRRDRRTAVEMAPAWKSQTDFHTGLEISHRTRDSHIPQVLPVVSGRNGRRTTKS